jgi:hypothetical protein
MKKALAKWEPSTHGEAVPVSSEAGVSDVPERNDKLTTAGPRFKRSVVL